MSYKICHYSTEVLLPNTFIFSNKMEKSMPPNYGPPGVAPPPGYAPPAGIAPPPGTTYPATNITVVPTQMVTFGPNPQIIICPSCHQHVTTNVRVETSSKTHLMAALLCLVSCCCIPYLMDSCKNKNHYCPSCGAYLGAYSN